MFDQYNQKISVGLVNLNQLNANFTLFINYYNGWLLLCL